MSFDAQLQTLLDSLITVIVEVLHQYFGAVFDLVDALLLLTA